MAKCNALLQNASFFTPELTAAVRSAHGKPFGVRVYKSAIFTLCHSLFAFLCLSLSLVGFLSPFTYLSWVMHTPSVWVYYSPECARLIANETHLSCVIWSFLLSERGNRNLRILDEISYCTLPCCELFLSFFFLVADCPVSALLWHCLWK